MNYINLHLGSTVKDGLESSLKDSRDSTVSAAVLHTELEILKFTAVLKKVWDIVSHVEDVGWAEGEQREERPDLLTLQGGSNTTLN